MVEKCSKCNRCNIHDFFCRSYTLIDFDFCGCQWVYVMIMYLCNNLTSRGVYIHHIQWLVLIFGNSGGGPCTCTLGCTVVWIQWVYIYMCTCTCLYSVWGQWVSMYMYILYSVWVQWVTCSMYTCTCLYCVWDSELVCTCTCLYSVWVQWVTCSMYMFVQCMSTVSYM